MKKFDAIIIGAGQAGVPLAHELARHNQKVAVIERKHPGGSCINYGCTPTKTMVASAKAAHISRISEALGVKNMGVEVDFLEVIKRRDKIVLSWRDGIRDGFKKHENITYFEGRAEFTDPKTLKIESKDGDSNSLGAEKIFINTGTSPRIPQIDGVDEVKYYTAKSMMRLTTLPEHLILIGGSYIGLEFGQMYKRFGSRVTVIEKNDQLVPREDEDIAAELKGALETEKINIITGAEIISAKPDGDAIKLRYKSAKETKSVNGSHLLIGAGTVANTAELNPEAGGIDLDDRGFIKTDEKLETSAEGVYALGDVKGGPQFTHISYDDYRIVSQNLLHNGHRTVGDRPVPYTMFTDPQLGRIGHNEKSARKSEIEYRLAKMPASAVARAIETGAKHGLMKVLVNPKNDKILGASILMPEGGETMATIQTAMMGGMTFDQFRDNPFAHPTYAESLNNLFSNLE
ncbi:MAG: mercuric reductase [Bacteroidales bacterium]|nr:mercuric reductase [Bacteroidales bacterium]MCF8345166.1 mercuric reductase [Bacteroidales bacterium]MCF8350564.1 mercuric reductase [Bacteroidales bacterium]MCF8377068.1 mercuric reductase [Bacteroidales bacterium]MCF8400942.1 mercuric reductase [Bacteroidales bacterium]